MSEFNLSVVNIISDANLQDVNDFAELCGCGPNNISVKLQDGTGAVFWACHSQWKPDDYAAFKALDIPQQYQTSMSKLYERAVLDGDAWQNWEAALSELGLVRI
ncbi:hypothetical protein E0H86_07145 [Acinetobacter sp. ANC 4635]|uniref:hypothetical protein n=1 Tax=Acinetobacter sp. ANC 4635 TaxID=2529846 RepID=UPI001040AB27|nr:hypothetical protein [Acinetobacter sp. ANC 4635]TCB32184.1 hypothetical protein E0H86_07145 [Acinetobacter sp. ANC 4635]